MLAKMGGFVDGQDGACKFARVSPLSKYLPQTHGYKETFADWELSPIVPKMA